jgi:hypothetical protein
MSVQNREPALTDVQPVIDKNIVNSVYKIFEGVLRTNALQDLFEDLSKRLIDDLAANSLLEYDLELNEDQKNHLRRAVVTKGNETVRSYLNNVNKDERTRAVYGVCRMETTAIVDAVLSSIGSEINRGAVINAQAVQANAKNDEYDEILLRKTKASGDITIPTNCILISTNCVAVIKSSCQKEATEEEIADIRAETSGKKREKSAADRPVRPSKGGKKS